MFVLKSNLPSMHSPYGLFLQTKLTTNLCSSFSLSFSLCFIEKMPTNGSAPMKYIQRVCARARYFVGLNLDIHDGYIRLALRTVMENHQFPPYANNYFEPHIWFSLKPLHYTLPHAPKKIQNSLCGCMKNHEVWRDFILHRYEIKNKWASTPTHINCTALCTLGDTQQQIGSGALYTFPMRLPRKWQQSPFSDFRYKLNTITSYRCCITCEICGHVLVSAHCICQALTASISVSHQLLPLLPLLLRLGKRDEPNGMMMTEANVLLHIERDRVIEHYTATKKNQKKTTYIQYTLSKKRDCCIAVLFEETTKKTHNTQNRFHHKCNFAYNT